MAPVDHSISVCPHRHRQGRRAGFALVLVLWVMALLALIVSAVITATRTRHDLTRYGAAQTQAKAVAEGGLYRTIHALLSRNGAGEPWQFGIDRSVAVGKSWARVQVRHEGGKLDLVAGSPKFIAELFRQCGLDRRDADALAADIVRVRRTAETGKGSGLTGLGDLVQLTGLTPADSLELQPLVTVHSASPDPIEPVTAPVLAARADWLGLSGSERRAAERRNRDRTIGRSHDLVEIRSTARIDGGADYVITAVVRLLPGTRTPFTIQSWERDYSDPGPLSGGSRLDCRR